MFPQENQITDVFQKLDRMINSYLFDIEYYADSQEPQVMRNIMAAEEQIRIHLARANTADLENLKQKYQKQNQDLLNEIVWRQANGKSRDPKREQLQLSLASLVQQMMELLSKRNPTTASALPTPTVRREKLASEEPPAPSVKKSLWAAAREIGVKIFQEIPSLGQAPKEVPPEPPPKTPKPKYVPEEVPPEPPPKTPKPKYVPEEIPPEPPPKTPKPKYVPDKDVAFDSMPTSKRETEASEEPPSRTKTVPILFQELRKKTEQIALSITDLPKKASEALPSWAKSREEPSKAPEQSKSTETWAEPSAETWAEPPTFQPPSDTASDTDIPTQKRASTQRIPSRPKPKHPIHPLTHQPIRKKPSKDKPSTEDQVPTEQADLADIENFTDIQDLAEVDAQELGDPQAMDAAKEQESEFSYFEETDFSTEEIISSDAPPASAKPSTTKGKVAQESTPNAQTAQQRVQEQIRAYISKRPKVNWRERDRVEEAIQQKRFQEERERRRQENQNPRKSTKRGKGWWPFKG